METNNLGEVRKRTGLRQIDVAQKLGHASSDRVSHWEKGLALPGMVNLFKLSIIYGVRPEDLYVDLHNSLVNDLKRKNGQESASLEDSGSNPFPVQSEPVQNVEKTQ